MRMNMMINYGNTTLDKILIVLFSLLATTLATHDVTNANNKHITNSTENSSSTAQGLTSALTTTAATSTSSSSTSSLVFAWGHVTKYSSILFDKDIVVKGSKTVNVKYPIEDDTNNFTIIGIYATDKQQLNLVPTAATTEVSAAILEGGIGYNYTTIRFVSKSLNDSQYNVIIYGVNV